MHQISFIYESVIYIIHRSLRSCLLNFSRFGDPWLLVGDFNSVLGAHVTTSNISYLSRDEFQAVITVCDLVENETRGFFYTRIGTRKNYIVLSRLDGALCSLSFRFLVSVFLCYLTQVVFGSPFFVDFLFYGCFCGFSAFQISGLWISHPYFLNLVRSVWSSVILGSGMGVLVQKCEASEDGFEKMKLGGLW